jgi:hypothetical protein
MQSETKPEADNLCTLLVQLHEYVSIEKGVDPAVCSKSDFCDSVNSRITAIIGQIICTPYTTNFNLPIALPAQATLQPLNENSS